MPVKPTGQQTPTLMHLPPFDFPDLEPCEAVQVATSPLWRDASMGWVAKINGDQSADIVYIDTGGGIVRLRACYHVDDPRCQIQTNRWDPNKRAHASGVFRKAPSSLQLERLEQRIRELEQRLTLLESGDDSKPYVDEPHADQAAIVGTEF